jgi:hypothetical protein
MARRDFITPPDLPTERIERCVRIPASQEWLGLLNSALLFLTQEWRYEQLEETAMTPEECSAAAMLVYEEYLGGNCLDCDDCYTGNFGLDDDADYRVDGVPQFSLDGGATWSDLPAGSSSPSVPALTATPGDDTEEKRCLASTRAALTISELYKQTAGVAAVDLFNTLANVARFLSDANRILFNLVYPDYYAVFNATGLFDCGTTCETYLGDTPALTSDDEDTLRCLLYDNATATAGGIVTFDFAAVSDNLIATLGVNPGTVLTLLLAYLGGDGLNRAGNVAVTDAALPCCETTWHIDRLFGDGNDDMTPVQIGTPTPRLCTYDSGTDKYVMLRTPDESNRIGAVKLTFDFATTLTHASFRQQRSDAAGGFFSFIRFEYGDTTTEDVVTVATPVGTGSTTIEWDGLREDVVAVYFRLAQGGDAGFLYLLFADLDGEGLNPVGE